MDFRHHTLDNGLEIVAEIAPNAYSSAYAFFVRTGARDESDAVSGVSHFLEHMVFKGSDRRSAAEVNRDLDDLSASSNAYTSEEQTVYFATTLPEDQAKIIDLLADMMRPSLRQDDFDTEKKVILEEIAKYDDQPPYGANEKCMAAFFGSHPLGRSVLGTTASVGNLARDQMLAYFQERYSPRNMVLIAAGNVDWDGLLRQADEHCGRWKSFDAPRPLPPALARQAWQVIHKPQATQQYVMQLSAGPAADDDDRYAARLLGTIVGDDTGSRLFWELVDTGLAETAAFGAHEFQKAGIFVTYLACAPEQTAESLARVRGVLADVSASGVTADELLRAQNKICAHLVLQAERPTNRLFAVGNAWIQRRQYKTVREAVDAYRRVTLDDITRVLKTYPLDRPASVAVGPLAELAAP
ncbi:MAG: insulinase family protein [Planctomycetaceae bacterium]|nr:insulinase family protein [Planctomycetaceae bacterium]